MEGTDEYPEQKPTPPVQMKWYEYRIVFGIPDRTMTLGETADFQARSSAALVDSLVDGTPVTVDEQGLVRRFALNRKARRDRARRTR